MTSMDGAQRGHLLLLGRRCLAGEEQELGAQQPDAFCAVFDGGTCIRKAAHIGSHFHQVSVGGLRRSAAGERQIPARSQPALAAARQFLAQVGGRVHPKCAFRSRPPPAAYRTGHAPSAPRAGNGGNAQGARQDGAVGCRAAASSDDRQDALQVHLRGLARRQVLGIQDHRRIREIHRCGSARQRQQHLVADILHIHGARLQITVIQGAEGLRVHAQDRVPCGGRILMPVLDAPADLGKQFGVLQDQLHGRQRWQPRPR